MKNNLIFTLLLLLAFAGLANAECTDFPSSVTASVTLPDQGKNHYSANNLKDGDQNTIWAATFRGTPITVTLTPTVGVFGVMIRNGYQRDQKSLINNSRAKNVKVYINDKSHLAADVVLEDVRTLPDYSEECDEEDTDDGVCYTDTYQSIYFLDYLEKNPRLKVKKIIVEFVSIYPGAKWNDLCISDIALFGGC